jgi:hypothetical protein
MQRKKILGASQQESVKSAPVDQQQVSSDRQGARKLCLKRQNLGEFDWLLYGPV